MSFFILLFSSFLSPLSTYFWFLYPPHSHFLSFLPIITVLPSHLFSSSYFFLLYIFLVQLLRNSRTFLILIIFLIFCPLSHFLLHSSLSLSLPGPGIVLLLLPFCCFIFSYYLILVFLSSSYFLIIFCSLLFCFIPVIPLVIFLILTHSATRNLYLLTCVVLGLSLLFPYFLNPSATYFVTVGENVTCLLCFLFILPEKKCFAAQHLIYFFSPSSLTRRNITHLLFKYFAYPLHRKIKP